MMDVCVPEIFTRSRDSACVAGDASGYAHGSEFFHDALSCARDAVTEVKRDHEGVITF